MTDFATEWTACMTGAGMPVPGSIFAGVSSATAAASAITSAIDKFGSEVTIGELIGARLLSEEFAAAGAILASAWVGVCLGCVASAAGSVAAGD